MYWCKYWQNLSGVGDDLEVLGVVVFDFSLIFKILITSYRLNLECMMVKNLKNKKNGDFLQLDLDRPISLLSHENWEKINENLN